MTGAAGARRRRTGRGAATSTWHPPEGNPGMNRLRRGVVTGLVPAVVALLVSLVVLAVVLALLGVDPVKSLKALFDFGPTPRAESNQIARGSTSPCRCSSPAWPSASASG